MPLQIRRGTEAERQAMTVPLAEGELLFVTNDQRIYVGTGTTLGGIPISGYNDEAAQDATAALFANGTHVNIDFVYDSNVSISATIDLSEYVGTIGADGIRAQILGIDNFVFFDSSSNRVVLEDIVTSDISPVETDIHSLGSLTNKFKDLYLSDSAWIGDAQITASGSSINLPAGSTVNGLLIEPGTGDGIVEGNNYRINIIGADSATIIDSTLSSVSANFITNGVVELTSNIIRVNEGSLDLQGEPGPGVPGTQVQVIGTSSTTTQNEPEGRPFPDNDIINSISTIQRFDIKTFKDSKDTGFRGDFVSGDVFCSLGFIGESDNGAEGLSAIAVQVDPAGTLTTDNVPTKIFLVNTPATAEELPAILSFDSLGRLAVNQQTAQATLDVNGFAKLAILTAPPATLADGMIAIADGTSWDPLTNGKQSMVVRLGGAWVQLAAAA